MYEGQTCRSRPSSTSGFTLTELVVVVLILAILAAVAVPRIVNARFDAEVNSIVMQVHAIEEAIRAYHAERGVWPGDAWYGNCEPLLPYISASAFHPSKPRSTITIGWAWVRGSPTIGMINYARVPAPMKLWQEVDNRIDDGDLSTGLVASKAGVFYYGVEK